MDKKDKIIAAHNALGTPVIAEFTENTLKIRRNLLVASAISIAISLGGLQINPGSEIFGIEFTGLTDELIKIRQAMGSGAGYGVRT